MAKAFAPGAPAGACPCLWFQLKGNNDGADQGRRHVGQAKRESQNQSRIEICFARRCAATASYFFFAPAKRRFSAAEWLISSNQEESRPGREPAGCADRSPALLAVMGDGPQTRFAQTCGPLKPPSPLRCSVRSNGRGQQQQQQPQQQPQQQRSRDSRGAKPRRWGRHAQILGAKRKPQREAGASSVTACRGGLLRDRGSAVALLLL